MKTGGEGPYFLANELIIHCITWFIVAYGRFPCGKAWLLHAVRNGSHAGSMGSNLELPLGREGPFYMDD